ncbi:CaiB/BaiF CoA-transferase family protein [Amycolatopsis australiensis]|uniref:Crotonobetainyl-CoA:carnitine CoA-transferase CaiB n=1 Tax=Amycolatopsis australiensis TaxID=546364 RepID=A0A1K1S2M8_9PSEU|nr:CoA transferase [Amycolatopsis australiensis]SFW78577.1 Crotonobetainyl-CoA:carnitine CoA-transferase CaiB [Amycolatopsis australiensis]
MRVLDLTDELARQGARLLVGLGADVVRVDPDDDLPRHERIHWHAGKTLATPAGLDALAREADVVLESGPVAKLRGLHADGTSRWPHAVHVVVTPFGLTGPRRGWLGGDLVLASAGGMTWLGGKPGGQPQPPPREQACQLAGAHGAIAALLGVLAGTGQLIDVSAQEAVAATLETGAISWIHAGRFPVRTGGVYEHVAHRIFAAADGYVAGGYSGSERMWTGLLSWLAEAGEAGDLLDERFADQVVRWAERPHVDDVIARFVAKRPASEVAEQGRARALPWAEVTSPAELTRNPQLRDRQFFVSVGGTEDAGFPWDAPGLPRPVTLSPLTEGRWRGVRSGRRPAKPRALDGVRVLDLTWVLAGPYATKILAEHGADVIKVESKHRHDPTRFSPSMRLRPDAGPDDSGYFLNFNRGKRSIALNLRTEEGQAVLRELAARCDVIVENFSPGVLAKWGLDYASLREINPRAILVSMSGVGHTGPWRTAVTFADTLAAMAGLSAETADPGGPPQGLAFGLGDMVAANAAVLGALDLLIRGHGGHVELSQLEAMAATMGPAVLDPGTGDPRTAEHPNRSRHAVPHGVYPAAGADRWVAITARDDSQWAALRDLTGLPSYEDRRRAEDEIDAALAAWTREQDAGELADRLQAAGVAAAVVATGRDLVEDRHLAARGFYERLDHPIAGPVLHEGIVARLTATPGALTSPAPLLGQHTEPVLRELLGFDDDRLAALRAAGITE